MSEKDLSEYKRKYHISRHHAWAGLGFLTITGILKTVLHDRFPDIIFLPILTILIIYILIAIIFTYRYHSGLSAPSESEKIIQIQQPSDVEKEKINAEVEKERLKIEKKKAKAQIKAEKKAKK